MYEPAGVSENQRAETRLTPYIRQITRGGGKPGQGYPTVLIPSTSSAAASPVRMSLPQVDERDFELPAPASSSSLHESLESYGPAGCWSRMFQGFTQAMQARISISSSTRLPNAGMVWRGECWIASISEFPNDAAESTLSAILEAHVPQRFYLSAKAARGILRRAERRGKELPSALMQALQAVATMGNQKPSSPSLKTKGQKQGSRPTHDSLRPGAASQDRDTQPSLKAEAEAENPEPSPYPTCEPLMEMEKVASECLMSPLSKKAIQEKSAQANKCGHLRENVDRDGELLASVRRLTPTECERLQAFPDGWTVVDMPPSETP